MKNTIEQENFIQAIKTSREGILLEAVAGSGKTTTLMQATQHIPMEDKTLALAFNKKIQEALADRFPPNIQCLTFNSLGHRTWMQSRGRIKLDARKMGSITSDVCKAYGLGDYWHEVKDLAEGIKKAGFLPSKYQDKTLYPAATLDTDALMSLCAQHDYTTDEVLIDAALEVLDISIKAAKSGVIDFDDQIFMPTYFSPAGVWIKYDNILVDEAQDLSKMQHDMIHRMCHEGTRIIAVGDPHQAIYGWRGAANDSMEQLLQRFSLKRMPLSVCFRCPKAVVEEAKQTVPHIQPFENNPDGVCSDLGIISNIRTFKAGSVILCRNNAPLVSLAFRFMHNEIPAYFSGRDLGYHYKKIVDEISEDYPDMLGAAIAMHLDAKIDLYESKDKLDEAERVRDDKETLLFIHESSQARDKKELKKAIEHLFRKEYSPDAIELSTIHKSKGKEWDVVYFLAPELIPGKWITKAAEEGKACAEWMLVQEENLRYVAITRALKELYYVNTKQEGE